MLIAMKRTICHGKNVRSAFVRGVGDGANDSSSFDAPTSGAVDFNMLVIPE
jgi:hypothetical protein